MELLFEGDHSGHPYEHGTIYRIGSKADTTLINTFGFIGGGDKNSILDDSDGDEQVQYGNVICGGRNNSLEDVAAFIGGGENNWLYDAGHGLIVGGLDNAINSDNYSLITGGDSNDIYQSAYAFMGGGLQDSIKSSYFAAIVSGPHNQINLGAWSVICGGDSNTILNASGDNSFVGGGETNKALTNSFTTVAGGLQNTASGFCSNIPGGNGLIANGAAQTVVGTFNIAKPSSPSSVFSASDPAFIVGGGGTDASTAFNAFEVIPTGHSIVFGTNGTGATTPNVVGATYNDNTLNAWAHCKWDNTGAGTFSVVSDHGCKSIGPVTPGVTVGRYNVILNLTKPDGTAINAPVDLCVTVTACDDGHEGNLCANPVVILTSPVTATFEIDMTQGGVCTLINHSFMMHVTGRY